MAGDCGECTQCCRLFAIEPLGKPAGEWCRHCRAGQGCTIYPERPQPCASFRCLWLATQGTKAELPPELRPDRCRVVMVMAGRELVLHESPGTRGGWRENRLLVSVVDRALADGREVSVAHGDSRRQVRRGAAFAR